MAQAYLIDDFMTVSKTRPISNEIYVKTMEQVTYESYEGFVSISEFAKYTTSLEKAHGLMIDCFSKKEGCVASFQLDLNKKVLHISFRLHVGGNSYINFNALLKKLPMPVSVIDAIRANQRANQPTNDSNTVRPPKFKPNLPTIKSTPSVKNTTVRPMTTPTKRLSIYSTNI